MFKKTVEHDGVVAGSIGCFVRDAKREIGYWIDRGFWGRGIASAALEQFLATIDARPLYARIANDIFQDATFSVC